MLFLASTLNGAFLFSPRLMHNEAIFICCLVRPRAQAIYPLSQRTRTRDLGLYNNPAGTARNIRYAPGPDKRQNSATQFLGTSTSYIEFPNRGRLDTKKSITLLVWIYHGGRAGPIFNYMSNGWGVHLWMISPRTLFVRFTRRSGRRFTPAVTSRRVLPRRWQYVGATYDYRRGIAKLFINRRFVASRPIGRIRLATNYPVRMGARAGDRRYFRGRISCIQVYDQPLTTSQILRRKKRCFTRGKNQRVFVLVARGRLLSNIQFLKLFILMTNSCCGCFTFYPQNLLFFFFFLSS